MSASIHPPSRLVLWARVVVTWWWWWCCTADSFKHMCRLPTCSPPAASKTGTAVEAGLRCCQHRGPPGSTGRAVLD